MKKILIALLFLLAACEVFGQGMPSGSLFRRVSDTALAKTNNARVPVFLKVGRRPDDPFPTYVKTFLSADSVASDSHYVVLSSWLSIPIPTTTLQHALAAELYYTAESDTMENNLVGQEISVNVPGRLVFDRATNHYGIYGLIVNGKPTTTNGNGYMEGRRFVGIYIDLADVSAGQVDSVRFDSTIGIWVPPLDGGRADSAFKKFSFIGANNIYTNDTLISADGLIVGAGGSDTGWYKADTILDISVWKTGSGDVPIIDSRLSGSTPMLRLYGDSAQVRFDANQGTFLLTVGDSAFTGTLLNGMTIAGRNGLYLNNFEVRSNNYTFLNQDGSRWTMPRNPGTNGQAIILDLISGTDSSHWGTPQGGSGGPRGYSMGRLLISVDGYYISEAGDTIANTGLIWDLGDNELAIQLFRGQTLTDITGIYFDSSSTGTRDITPGRSAYLSSNPLVLNRYATGGVKFYWNTSERMKAVNTDWNGMNVSSMTDWLEAYIDSVFTAKLEAISIYTDSVQGLDTNGVPTMGDPLDMNGYSITNADSVEANRLSGDTVRASVWEGLPDSLAGISEVKALVTDSLDDVRAALQAAINASLGETQILNLVPSSWPRPLADSIIVMGPKEIWPDSDSSRTVALIDSSFKVGTGSAIRDTIGFSAVMPDTGRIDSIFISYISSGANHFITETSTMQARITGGGQSDSLVEKITTDRDFTTWTNLWINTTDMVVGKNKRVKVRLIFDHTGVGTVTVGEVTAAWRRP